MKNPIIGGSNGLSPLTNEKMNVTIKKIKGSGIILIYLT